MSNIIEEIKSEVAQERWHNLWKKYQRHVYAAAAGIVLLTAGHVWWTNHQASVSASQSALYIQAVSLTPKNKEEALHLFERIPSAGETVYATLARFWIASILLEQGDKTGALSIYKIIESKNAGLFSGQKKALFAKTALFRRLYLEVDQAPGMVLKEVKGYTTKSSPWRQPALELKALAHLKLEQPSEAKDSLNLLVNDKDTPANLKTRAMFLLSYLNTKK